MPDRPPPSRSDLTDRAITALREVVGPLPDLDAQQRPAARPRWWHDLHRAGVWAVAAAALAAVVLLQLVTFLPPQPAAREGTGVLPDPFPPYSHIASSAERDPAGPALMAFTYGLGVEFMDIPQAVVLGADGTTYRHLRTAGAASTPDDQGDPGPFLLSPDGTAVAVGTTGDTGSLWVVDLLTGDRTRWTVREGSSAFPVGWSTDGGYVFVSTSGGAVNKYAGRQPQGDWRLHRVDLHAADGAVTALPGDPGEQPAVAALPGGAGLLVTTDGVTELRTADGATTLLADTGLGGRVTSGSVSPDGSRVVTALGGAELSGVQVSTLRDGRAEDTSSVELDTSAGSILGWLDEHRVLLSTYDNDTNNSRLHLWALDIDTGSHEELLVAEPGWTGAAVFNVSVAADLLDGASVQGVDDVDRGYPYVALRALAGLLTLVLAHRVWRVWRRRRSWGPAL